MLNCVESDPQCRRGLGEARISQAHLQWVLHSLHLHRLPGHPYIPQNIQISPVLNKGQQICLLTSSKVTNFGTTIIWMVSLCQMIPCFNFYLEAISGFAIITTTKNQPMTIVWSYSHISWSSWPMEAVQSPSVYLVWGWEWYLGFVCFSSKCNHCFLTHEK